MEAEGADYCDFFLKEPERFRTDTEKTYIALTSFLSKLYSLCDYVVNRGVLCDISVRNTRVIGVGYSVYILCWFYSTLVRIFSQSLSLGQVKPILHPQPISYLVGT